MKKPKRTMKLPSTELSTEDALRKALNYKPKKAKKRKK